MNKVLFIFDRVAHYHRELFKTLESEFPEHGLELHLLSGVSQEGATGRVGLKESVVTHEYKYRFVEHKIGSYVLRQASGIFEQINALRPAIVVCMGHVGNFSHWKLIALKQKLGFKLVAWQCGYEYNPGIIKTLLLPWFVPQFDLHLAYHTNAKKYAIQHGASEKDIVVMHNTINEVRIPITPKQEARAIIASHYPEIGDRKILLFVGAVLEEKKIENIIRALDCLQRPDLMLVIVGDGPHLAAIRELCQSRQDVLMTGQIIEGVGTYFDAAEMYLLPGTGGLGINEAMAHSLPVLSGFADGSADDLVIDNINGFRLQKDSPDELAQRIQEITDNPGMAAAMGKRSREMITGKFSFSEFINRIHSGILSLIQ